MRYENLCSKLWEVLVRIIFNRNIDPELIVEIDRESGGYLQKWIEIIESLFTSQIQIIQTFAPTLSSMEFYKIKYCVSFTVEHIAKIYKIFTQNLEIPANEEEVFLQLVQSLADSINLYFDNVLNVSTLEVTDSDFSTFAVQEMIFPIWAVGDTGYFLEKAQSWLTELETIIGDNERMLQLEFLIRLCFETWSFNQSYITVKIHPVTKQKRFIKFHPSQVMLVGYICLERCSVHFRCAFYLL